LIQAPGAPIMPLMIGQLAILGAGLAYLGALFAVAAWGDRRSRTWTTRAGRPLIYALSLGVYCTSWTYFGSVGIASRTGLDFIPIYLGPILVFALGWKLIQSIATLTKRHNIASIADFLSARYGKSEALGALVTVIAVIGIVPYISIQLKAVAVALGALISEPQWSRDILPPSSGLDGLSLFVVLTMGVFAILFGTRHSDTTEHQDGMILAIAVESMVKLIAFVAVGLFVVFGMMGGIGPFLERATADSQVRGLFSGGLDGGQWLTLTLLAAFAVVLLPRQFHVAAVENANAREVKRAAWLFPLYLVAINIFVIPIAVAGLLLPPGADGDTFVLALPVSAGNPVFALIAFLGGLSASTAMVIVECIALSIMVCNNLVVPLLLRRQSDRATVHQDMGETLILIRRLAIIFVLALAYAYYRMIGASVALAQVGLLSFAAVAQFAPAFADAGWLGRGFIEQGPWGISLLKARALFTMEFNTLTHGVIWSLLANITAYVADSLTRQPTPIERVQATSFVSRDIQAGSGTGLKLWRTAVTADRLEDTVARYIGADRAAMSHVAMRAEVGV